MRIGYIFIIGIACSIRRYWRCALYTQIPLAVALGSRGPGPPLLLLLKEREEKTTAQSEPPWGALESDCGSESIGIRSPKYICCTYVLYDFCFKLSSQLRDLEQVT